MHLMSVLFALPLLLPCIARADAPLVFEQGIAHVSFQSGDAALARQTAAAIEDASAIIRSKLGITLSGPVRAHIVRGRDEFNRLVRAQMPDWAMAVALRPDKIIVDADKVTPGTEDNLRLTTIHEVAHLALFSLERPGHALPRWFHEGTATWVSGVMHFSADWRAFDLAVAQNALPKLSTMEESFPEEAGPANVAYLESAEFVRYLVRSHGDDALRWVLQEYRGGKDFQPAFRDALGESVGQAETDWRDSMRRRFPWLRALVSSISFWSIMAALTIIVFLVVRRRGKRQREQWEREERDWEVVGEEDDGPDESEDDEYEGPEEEEEEEWF